MAKVSEVAQFSSCELGDGKLREFRQIADFPDYFISDDGLVVSAKRPKLRFQKPHHNQGYVRVNLGAPNTHIRAVLLHRLILETFRYKCPEGLQVRHINGIRDDNRLANLEWGTIKENADDRVLHGTSPVGVKNPRAKLTEEQVRMIRSSPKQGAQLGRELGVSKGMIYFIRQGKNWRNVA